MKQSIIKNLIKEEIKNLLKEEKQDPTQQHVQEFISQVLKLGSKQNIFDSFMTSNNIKEDELSTFIEMVVDEIKKTYL